MSPQNQVQAQNCLMMELLQLSTSLNFQHAQRIVSVAIFLELTQDLVEKFKVVPRGQKSLQFIISPKDFNNLEKSVPKGKGHKSTLYRYIQYLWALQWQCIKISQIIVCIQIAVQVKAQSCKEEVVCALWQSENCSVVRQIKT